MALGFVALTCLYLRLTPWRFAHAITPDPGDPLFNLALLRWGADRAVHGFSDFWNPTFFYPLKGVLALSDHLAGPALLAAVLGAAGLSPASVYDTLLVLAFAGGAWTCFLVLRWSGVSAWGSVLAGLAWSYSCFRWTALSHLQVLLALWIPLVLWSFDRLLAAPDWRRAGLFFAAYAAHVSGGAYLAYMVHFPLAALLVVRARYGWRRWASRKAASTLVVSALACGGFSALLFVPYLELGKRFGLSPSLAEVGSSLVTLRSYASVGARTLYADLVPGSLRSQPALWFGLVPLALVCVAVWSWFGAEMRTGRQVPPSEWWLTLALVGSVLLAFVFSDLRLELGDLSSGTDRRAIFRGFRVALLVLALAALAIYSIVRRGSRRPLSDDRQVWWRGLLAGGLLAALVSHAAVFALLRAGIPGLEAIRVPGRFFLFSSFALAALAGRGVDALRSRIRAPGPSLWVPAVLVLLTAFELAPRVRFIPWLELPSPAEAPGVYRWLEEQTDVEAVVELPMLEYWREAERMYFWTIHRKPIVNGYSAYLPPSYVELQASLQDFPGPEVTHRLSDLGVSHLVIHLDQLSRSDRRAWSGWQKTLDNSSSPWMEKIHEEDWAMIYRLTRSRE